MDELLKKKKVISLYRVTSSEPYGRIKRQELAREVQMEFLDL